MISPKTPAKRMDLGVTDADIDAQLAAAKEVAKSSNIPTHTYPKDEAAPAQPIAASKTGNVTMLPTQPSASERKARGPKPASVRRYSVDLPLYVIDEIHHRAFKQKKTKKQVILEALNAGGLEVKDIDVHAEARDA